MDNHAQGYNLPRDTEESARLNRQHVFFKSVTGYLITPTIQATLPPNALVADVGTGTGVWLQDLSTTPQAESYTLHGYDVSADQFPPPDPISPNRITYDTLNILDPIPEPLRNKYDLVHLRLLLCGLRETDFPVAARNIFSLLKPGGHVQWLELAPQRCLQLQHFPFTARTKPASRTLLELMNSLNNATGRLTSITTRLPSVLAEVGFEDTSDDVFGTSLTGGASRTEMNFAAFGAYRGSCRSFLKVDEGMKRDWDEEKLEGLFRDAWRELDEGMTFYQGEMYIASGRRPEGGGE